MPDMTVRGLFPPIPTPFDQHEGVELYQLQANITRWNQCGFAGYVVLGSNGEFVHLTERERLHVLEVARDAIAPDLMMIAGCTCQSLAETLIYIKQAARLGAQVALVNPPFYFKNAMTPPRIESFFTRVADESPIPILLYNVPQFSGLTLSLQSVVHLAEHPNIIGIKDSSGDIAALEHILRLTPPTFNVLIGSAYAFYPGLALGAHGAVLAVSFIAWEACRQLLEAVQTNQHAKARDIQLRLAPLAAALDIPGLKAALELRGLYGGPPRSPLAPVTPEQRNEIRQMLADSGLIPDLEP